MDSQCKAVAGKERSDQRPAESRVMAEDTTPSSLEDCRVVREVRQSMRESDSCFREWLVRVGQFELVLIELLRKRVRLQAERNRLLTCRPPPAARAPTSEVEKNLAYRRSRITNKLSKKKKQHAEQWQKNEQSLSQLGQAVGMLKLQLSTAERELSRDDSAMQHLQGRLQEQQKRHESRRELLTRMCSCKQKEQDVKMLEKKLLVLKKEGLKLSAGLASLKNRTMAKPCWQQYLGKLDTFLAASGLEQLQCAADLHSLGKQIRQKEREQGLGLAKLQNLMLELEEAASEERVLGEVLRGQRLRSKGK